MNILVLLPKKQSITYSYFLEAEKRFTKKINYLNTFFNLPQITKEIIHNCHIAKGKPDIIAIRSPFGTPNLNNPLIITNQSLIELTKIGVLAPMHLPTIVEFIHELKTITPHSQIMVFFENAFFFNLPQREAVYALDITQKANLRRYGYNGLFHNAACDLVINKTRKLTKQQPFKIISICLEPYPEIIASKNKNPIMVSSGSTPLEGIMGNTSAGQLDPSIVITLSKELNWGPEKINQILTCESGIKGITGRDLSLEDIFCKDADEEMLLSQKIIQYQILKLCGSAIACMGGLDNIVFSGRYARQGEHIGPFLLDHFANRTSSSNKKTISLDFYTDSLDQIIAKEAIYSYKINTAATNI